MITTTETCRYNFTAKEMIDIARTQARLMSDMTGSVEQFDQVKADHKSKITLFETQISDCTRRITQGYEMRVVKCLLLKFRPARDSAMLVRLDNGRVVRVRKLDESEKQIELTEHEPPAWAFEADFYEDSESDVAEQIASSVPLTAQEAESLKEVVEVRPRRRLLEDGKRKK